MRHKVSEADKQETDEWQLSESDSIMIQKAEGKAPSAYFASLKLDAATYSLKGGYMLSLYPSYGNRVYNVRLRGDGIDSVILQRSTGWQKYIEHYDNADFDNYFIITSYRDHYLFRKSTGEMVCEMVSWSADFNHNLLLYDGTTLLNLKNWKKVRIEQYKHQTFRRWLQ